MTRRGSEDGIFELFCIKEGLLTQAQMEQVLQEQLEWSARGQCYTLEQLALGLRLVDPWSLERLKTRLNPEFIPGYRIHEVLGRGGKGTVYRATQLSMQRDVAIKILSQELSKDAKFCEKFLLEARHSAKLNHENIMGGIDCGEAHGVHYFVMELVEGEALAELIDREGALPVREVLSILEQVAKGLKHAHEQKIVHRDIKPENIMLSSEKIVKICDLGLARPEIQAGQGEKDSICEGTPYYCAPEQALGHTDIDARADIYALGMTLYHLLVGKVAFDGPDARSILLKQIHEPFPDIKAKVPDLSASEAQMIHAMVAKDREARLESMDALLALLSERKSQPKISKPTTRRRKLLAGMRPSSSSIMPIIFTMTAALIVPIAGFIYISTSGSDEKKKTERKNKTAPSKPRVIPIKLGPKKPPQVESETSEPTPVSEPKNLKERQAKQLLNQAQEFELNHPDKLSVALGKYRDIVDQFGATQSATKAKVRLKRLLAKGRQRLKASWLKAQSEVRDKSKAGQYRKAFAALESFRESYDSVLLKSFLDDIQAVSEEVQEAAKKELGVLTKSLEVWAAGKSKAEDQGNLGQQRLKEFEAFAGRAPEELAKPIAAAKAKVKKLLKVSAARSRAQALVRAVQKGLYKADLAKAKSLLDTANKTPELANSTIVAGMKREFLAIERLWHEFDKNVLTWKGKTRSYTMSSGNGLKATLQDYDPQKQLLKLKVYGRKKILVSSFSDLAPAEIEQLNRAAASMADKILRVKFLIYRGLAVAASESLAKAKEAGFDDTAVENKLLQAIANLQNHEAKALVKKVQELAKKPDNSSEIIRVGTRLITEFARTSVFKDKQKPIRSALVSAFVAEIVNQDPGQLFKCEARRQSKRNLKYQLKYDFSDPKQRLDFLVDKKTLQDSAVSLVERTLDITGRIQHVASWLGGSLEVSLRLRCKNAERPNINLMIADQGGALGTFVGIGSQMKKTTEITLDASVRPGGVKVLLPANLIADATSNGFKYVFADPRSVLKTTPDKVLRYGLQRSRRGGLSVKVGSKTLISVSKNSPNYDKPGHVGFYLDGVGLVLHEVLIEGTLDPTWARQYAQKIASKKVAELLAKTQQNLKTEKKSVSPQ